MTSYFDLAAANARLAELRPALESLRRDRDVAARAQRRLQELGVAGDGQGSSLAGVPEGTEAAEAREALLAAVHRMKAAVQRIDGWGITLRDIGSGLVDFPALANGRPIWLCWRLGEGDIGWWHELESGVAGRRPLIELE